MSLVIVESPAKCSKIQGFLGEGYTVKATMGHIRVLDESLDALGMENNWTPTYVELPTKKDSIAALKKAAKGKTVILATDDDREGEGIAWHVCFLLKLNPVTTQRIVFHEITKPAIQLAVSNPRCLDLHKVNAQQARAMLDLLVGFTISRVLWSRVAPKLSAGRCQTPALRLVVDRDMEVDNHKASAFWTISGKWKYDTLLLEAQGIKEYKDEKEASAVLEKVYNSTKSTIQAIKESVSISNPPQPFITSTLQQEASSHHGLNPKTTMNAAQKLYEAGHITYMRTDNAILSEEAQTKIRSIIISKYGNDYVENSVHSNKPKDNVQAAHEAIRPTHPETVPELEDNTQKIIYHLIWKRTLQSCMKPSLTNVRKTTITIDTDLSNTYIAEQSEVKFAGYKILDNIKITPMGKALSINTILDWNSLQADEHYTKPKGRYTEASLIAELEKRGIGRPSTFASLVSTIIDRDYVEKTNEEGKTTNTKHYLLAPRIWPPSTKLETHKVGAEKNKLKSTSLGKSVSDFLHREYNDLFEYEFTSKMESELDNISHGTKEWKSILQETWDKYKERYNKTIISPSKASRERNLDEGYKVIMSRKGPLFVKTEADAKPIFTQIPTEKTFETVTLEDAKTAFTKADETKEGTLLGMYETKEIRKKKGPYGFYIQYDEIKLPAKIETLEQTIERIKVKQTQLADPAASYSRVVGDFTIKRGPYGLYFYKHALKKIRFVKFPASLDAEKVVEKDLQLLYSKPIKKPFVKKNDSTSEPSQN
jgi:DNA topoisomerase-1